jgi:hypothetical protein
MNIVIFEIKKPINISKNTIKKFADDYARFVQEYSDSWLVVIPEKVLWEGNAELFTNPEIHDIRFEKLNKFAMSRLISNFEDKHPELSLIMMGAGEDSKLIKVSMRKK